MELVGGGEAGGGRHGRGQKESVISNEVLSALSPKLSLPNFGWLRKVKRICNTSTIFKRINVNFNFTHVQLFPTECLGRRNHDFTIIDVLAMLGPSKLQVQNVFPKVKQVLPTIQKVTANIQKVSHELQKSFL